MSYKEELIEINLSAKNQWRIVEKDIEIDSSSFRRVFNRSCIICGRNFKAPGMKNKCSFCSLEFQCNYCNKWKSFNILKMYKLDFNLEYGCLEHCHYIGAKIKMSEGNCCNCNKFVSKRDQFCFGYDCGCHEKMYTKHNKSDTMIRISSENGKKYGPKNLIKYNKSEKGRETSSRIIRRVNKLNLNSFIGSQAQKEHLYRLNTQGRYNSRKHFYEDKIKIVQFDSIEKEINLEDFDDLYGLTGVWSRWTDSNHGSICLDVCKTTNIGQEMLSSLRSFYRMKTDVNYSYEKGWEQKYKKQLKDCGNGKIIFKLVSICDNQIDALRIEAQYAKENRAKYWSFGPGEYTKIGGK